MLQDPENAPTGRNILQLNNTQKTENYTCVAVSMLGNIEKLTTVYVKGESHYDKPNNSELSDRRIAEWARLPEIPIIAL